MVITVKENIVGARIFLAGVILSIAAGILSFGELNTLILGILVAIGLVVGFGFIGISDKEVNTFLLASVSLVIVSWAGIQGVGNLANTDLIGRVWSYISSILAALLVMLVPATIIVAIKSLFSVAKR